MRCPRCDNSALEERDREGIAVDIFRECRGVWLDRGELEKIISRSARELDRYERGRPRDDDDDDDDHDDARERTDDGRRPPRKRSWLENLGDIFD